MLLKASIVAVLISVTLGVNPLVRSDADRHELIVNAQGSVYKAYSRPVQQAAGEAASVLEEDILRNAQEAGEGSSALQEEIDRNAAQSGNIQALQTLQQVKPALATLAGCTILALIGGGAFMHFARINAPAAAAALLYLGTSVAIDTCIALSHVHAGTKATFAFNPMCCIMIVEFGKLIVSLTLFAASRLVPMATSVEIVPASTKVDRTDVGWMAIPALLFTLNNALVFMAIGNNEVSTFGAFRETMILWTALIWTTVFKVPLGMQRSSALMVIMFGLCLNQVQPLLRAHFSPAVFFVCLMALANACGSVCNEYVLKRRPDLDLNLQNAMLYSWCFLLSTFLLAITDHRKLMSVSEFFSGFETITCIIAILQLSAGILVSRILKYADSLHKNVVAAMRGPALVLLAPHLGLPSYSDPLTLVSAVVVGSASAFFLMQGRPK